MREPDAVFADQRQADLYDAIDSDRSDLDAYVAIAREIGARRVVDVGCGTGSLAVRLAGLEIEVVGVDPAEASLNVARTKPYAELVRWIHGDATNLDPSLAADLVVMTGNVAQVFVSDEDWSATLQAAKACLRPGGWLVFETRRPEARDWENWDIAPTRVEMQDGREAVVVRTVTEVALPRVTFEGSTTIGDEVLRSTSTLRFRERHEIESDLARIGFIVVDVREAPDRPGKEFVFVAENVESDAARAMDQAGRDAEVNAEFREVTIDGEIVTRPAGVGTQTVHSFLRHLRAEGLKCIAAPIDVVDGIERLTYLAGESGGDGWYHQHTDEGLASAARLLRTIHDAGRDWQPPADAVWGAEALAGDDLVFCHGDPGPWNFVWRDREAIGLLDWDYLHPAPRLDDVAYALHWFVPLRRDEFVLEWHHFPEVPDRRHRIRVFLEAYGDLPHVDVVEVVTTRMQATIDLVRSLAEQGQEPQRTWVAEGSLEREAEEIDWVRRNRDLFT